MPALGRGTRARGRSGPRPAPRRAAPAPARPYVYRSAPERTTNKRSSPAVRAAQRRYISRTARANTLPLGDLSPEIYRALGMTYYPRLARYAQTPTYADYERRWRRLVGLPGGP